MKSGVHIFRLECFPALWLRLCNPNSVEIQFWSCDRISVSVQAQFARTAGEAHSLSTEMQFWYTKIYGTSKFQFRITFQP